MRLDPSYSVRYWTGVVSWEVESRTWIRPTFRGCYGWRKAKVIAEKGYSETSQNVSDGGR